MTMYKSRTAQLNGLTSLAYVGVLPSSPTNFFIKQTDPTTGDYRNAYVGDMWLNNNNQYLSPPMPITGANLWILVSIANHSATWINFFSGVVLSVGAGNNIQITGSPTSPIVNVFGTINHSVLLGNATGSINSLTNGVSGQVLTAVTGADPIWVTQVAGDITGLLAQDGNTVTPTAGIIQVSGSNGLTTTGTVGPNTLTVTAGGEIAQSFITNPATGTATPAAGVLTFAGTGGTTVSAAGSTVTINSSVSSGSVMIMSNVAGFTSASGGISSNIATAAGISYSGPNYFNLSTAVGSLVGAQFIMPLAGTISSFYVDPTTNNSPIAVTFTLNINGSNTSVSVTIPGASTVAVFDNVHTQSINIGDLVAFQATPATGGTIISGTIAYVFTT